MISKSRRGFAIFFNIFLTVVLIAIALAAFLHVRETDRFNAAGRSFSSEEAASDCDVAIVQKGSWPKEDSLIKGVNTGGQYDVTVSNLSPWQITDWALKINVLSECYLNQGWNGTVEIHQCVAENEKSQTLDLHDFSFSFDDVTLDYTGLDKNNLMIKLRPGDYIIYHPTSDPTFHEDTLSPYNGTPGSTTTGLIFYYPEQIELSDYTLTYHFNKSIFQGREFVLLFFACILWLLMAIVFVVWVIVRRKAEHELREREAMLDETLDLISHFVDAKDPYTNGHSDRVSVYSYKLAKKLGMNSRGARYVYYAAILHDVGKSYVPDEILKKPDKLTDEEYEKIKSHTVLGYEMLKSIKSIFGIADGAHYHHERYDGLGYPTGKAGKDIPYIARIICVADSFDAMNSSRCYRGHMTKESILDELREGKGKQFDPAIVDAMLSLLESGEIDFDDIESAKALPEDLMK